MICTSYNIRGLAGATRCRALRHYLAGSETQVILLQETMVCAADAIKYFLMVRPNWRVAAIDANGLSGGILTAWNPAFGDFDAFVTVAGLLLDGFVRGFGEKISILNVYGPYRDRQTFWTEVDESRLLARPNLILGGDLNLTLGPTEIWAGTTLEDTLSSFFKELFIRYNLIDIPLLKAGPTWTNGRRGAKNVSKRLDRFLVA